MATKNTKKTAAKPAAKPPVVPAVVLVIRGIAVNLRDVPNVPDDLKDARIKVIASIDRLGNRIAANLAGAGKRAEKEAAKVEREATKAKRDVAKRDKKLASIKTMKEKLAKMEKELVS